MPTAARRGEVGEADQEVEGEVEEEETLGIKRRPELSMRVKLG